MVRVISNTMTSDLPTYAATVTDTTDSASGVPELCSAGPVKPPAVPDVSSGVPPESSPVLPPHGVVDRPAKTMFERIAASIPAETSRARCNDRADYDRWLERTGRDGFVDGEAAAEHLAEYVNDAAERGLAPATIARRLSTIATAYRAQGLDRPDTLAARAVLKGYKLERAEAGKRTRKATPITPAVLRTMIAALDLDTKRGRRDRAVLLLGFALGARRSTLARLNVGEIRAVDAHELAVWLRRSKTDKEADGKSVQVLSGSDPATCPVRAWAAWRADLDDAGLADDAQAPAFVRFDRRGRLATDPGALRDGGSADGRISGEAVGIIVDRAAKAAGLPPEAVWTAHGLRRGYATAAHEAGADLLAIGRHGEGWTDGSTSLLGYIEEAATRANNPLRGIGL